MSAQSLLAWAETRGYQVAWGAAAVLDDVRLELQQRISSGELDAGLARDQLSSFVFPPAATDAWAAVVVAMRRPAHRVGFMLGGVRIDAILPPTYVRYRPTFLDVCNDLHANALAPARVEVLNVPLKPLAARLGLVRYGRNNLCYSSAFGSYMQLVGYLTDADLAIPSGWQPAAPQLLEECEDCSICEAVCPTSAIDNDRVLLHAERCLTCVNESSAPLPSWVPSAAHHALLGCLRCQVHCPANRELQIEDSCVLFSEEETMALLDGSATVTSAWPGWPKMERLQLTEANVVGRNFRVLVAATTAGSRGNPPPLAASAG